jgi:hypothetical protein
MKAAASGRSAALGRCPAFAAPAALTPGLNTSDIVTGAAVLSGGAVLEDTYNFHPTGPGDFSHSVGVGSALTTETLVLTNAPVPGITSSLTISPGGPLGGVPEPASWALMILGFSAIGATSRRARRRALRAA